MIGSQTDLVLTFLKQVRQSDTEKPSKSLHDHDFDHVFKHDQDYDVGGRWKERIGWLGYKFWALYNNIQ